jgi:tripartite tricarboxylate transporter family receptor
MSADAPKTLNFGVEEMACGNRIESIGVRRCDEGCYVTCCQHKAERLVSKVLQAAPLLHAGAGTIIGTEAVARATPDGTTLLITAPYLLIVPHLRKLNFDPLTGFEPICHLVSSPWVIVVNSSSPYRTLGDFLDAARAKPGVDLRSGRPRYRGSVYDAPPADACRQACRGHGLPS